MGLGRISCSEQDEQGPSAVEHGLRRRAGFLGNVRYVLGKLPNTFSVLPIEGVLPAWLLERAGNRLRLTHALDTDAADLTGWVSGENDFDGPIFAFDAAGR